MSTHMSMSLNMTVRGLKPSATLAINELSKARIAEGRTTYRLGLGQSPFPVPDGVVEALRLHAAKKDYLPPEGLWELREAVASCHRREEGVEARACDVLVGPGSKELMFLLQLVYYGELLLPSPCWVSYVPQATILSRAVRLVHTSFESRWQLSAERLDAYCRAEKDDSRPRILLLNYPGNPDGGSYTEDELAELAEVARRYEVVLLSDEIYGRLHHEGRHASVARFYPEGTIISGGLSKWCGAGGWRLGTFTFPPRLDWLLRAMAAVASETFTSVCAPVQFAAVRAFRGDLAIERYLWHARRILAALGGRCAATLQAAGARVWPPVGGFYLFPDFEPLRPALAARGIGDSETLCLRLLEETGVAILPGSAFGRPPEELSARIAYVDFDGTRALTASERIAADAPLPEDFVELWCRPVIEAVEKLVTWLEGG